MKAIITITILAIAGLLTLAGCKSTPPITNRTDFLSTYDHLQKVDATTWRYVSPPLLANCNQFTLSPVKVLFTDFAGQPISDEQRKRSAEFVHQAVREAVSPRYPIVSEKGPEVADIRLALTSAYGAGGKPGLCVEGEIVDNSNNQVAAVIRTELTQNYSPEWEDKPTARQMVNEWVQRMLKVVDQAHGR